MGPVLPGSWFPLFQQLQKHHCGWYGHFLFLPLLMRPSLQCSPALQRKELLAVSSVHYEAEHGFQTQAAESWFFPFSGQS